MEGIFLRLLNMSIQASVLIVIIAFLRIVLKKSPKWLICLLWALVAARLAFPFTIESRYSLAPNRKRHQRGHQCRKDDGGIWCHGN